jgi:hypothetical protein
LYNISPYIYKHECSSRKANSSSFLKLFAQAASQVQFTLLLISYLEAKLATIEASSMISSSIGGKNRFHRFFPPIELEIIELASIGALIMSMYWSAHT